MNLTKVKGIIIKETPYKDNDKIVTILTDKLGKISCLAKGAKKNNSPILASSQYLVYSEFVLYKGTSFYQINSANVLLTFYNFRVDFDKLQIAFELTKIIQQVTDENQDTEQVLKLFLNTIYALDNLDKDKRIIVTAFKIRLFAILGFAPVISRCNQCLNDLTNKKDNEKITIYYDYVSNVFLCSECIAGKDMKRYIKVNEATIVAIRYVCLTDIKKIFSFDIKDIENFNLFGQVYTDTMINGLY